MAPHESQPPPAGFETEALVHLDAVFRFARSLAGDDVAAEDLTQETFLQALRHWDQYTLGTNCRAWLFTICRNARLQAIRRSREDATEDADLESMASAAIQSGLSDRDPEGRFFESPDLEGAVRDAVNGLPEEFREVVVLCDLEDQTYDTAARIVGVPIGTVKSRLYRGRRILQEKLVAHAIDAGLLPLSGGTR